MVDVAINWKKINWLPDEKWKSVTIPKLTDVGLNKLNDLKRSVYVIRLDGDYCVAYPTGDSPVLYIGEGNFKSRLNHHKKNWLKELEELVGEFAFEIKIAVPRVRANPNAYKDFEAELIIKFREKFGSAPLWNKQIERRTNPHYSYKSQKINEGIGTGSGKKYKWAFKPMKSSPFHRNYIKTHL